MGDYLEKRYYSIEALKISGIQVPTTTPPDLVYRLLASIVSYQQGINSVDCLYKRYEKDFELSVVSQYEGPEYC